MACIQTPNNLDVLMHCHVSPTPHPRAGAPAVEDALEFLYQEGLIECVGGNYNTTKKGRFYLEHLLRQPFPETVFCIPVVE